ncbi:hypothetical protein M0802_000226 [Mischocyttarus mexicanus]|nr:hypothetical protein M0802_000226 [Mischocyttarus mexicanus]
MQRYPKVGYCSRIMKRADARHDNKPVAETGNRWPNQEREYVTENPKNILSDYNVHQDSSVRLSNIPILSTSILPPLRKEPISWAAFSRNNDEVSTTMKSSLILVNPTETTFSDQNEMIKPIVVNTIPRYSTALTTSPIEIISPETRTTVLESLINPETITVAPDGNANIIGIERYDEIASDDRSSNKLFLCGSLRNELIVSRPGSGSVFIKGASRVAIINDAQNSVIVCQPSTNLLPPSLPEERLPTPGMDLERKPLTLRPTSVFLSELPKTHHGYNEQRPSTILLKDYLLPPYTY